jgi:hypothetical protein
MLKSSLSELLPQTETPKSLGEVKKNLNAQLKK